MTSTVLTMKNSSHDRMNNLNTTAVQTNNDAIQGSSDTSVAISHHQRYNSRQRPDQRIRYRLWQSAIRWQREYQRFLTLEQEYEQAEMW